MTGRVLTALTVAAALVAVAIVAKTSGSPPAPRAAAAPVPPKVTFTGTFDDMGGAKFDLASLAGKPVVINLWATWCGPCKLETPQLVALYEKFRSRGLAIVGISVDDQPDAIRAFASEYKVSYPMLVGTGHDDFARLLGYDDELPFSVLVQRDGTIVGQITGLETTADWERRLENLIR